MTALKLTYIVNSKKVHIHTEYSIETNTISFQIKAIFDKIADVRKVNSGIMTFNRFALILQEFCMQYYNLLIKHIVGLLF